MAKLTPDGSIVLTLPFPPSNNNYKRLMVRRGKPLWYLTEQTQQFKADVALTVGKCETIDGPVSVDILVWVPDKRKRDLDNLPKCTFDALTDAGIWADDSQVVEYRVVKKGIEKGGRLIVRIKQVESMLF